MLLKTNICVGVICRMQWTGRSTGTYSCCLLCYRNYRKSRGLTSGGETMQLLLPTMLPTLIPTILPTIITTMFPTMLSILLLPNLVAAHGNILSPPAWWASYSNSTLYNNSNVGNISLEGGIVVEKTRRLVVARSTCPRTTSSATSTTERPRTACTTGTATK